MARPDQVTIPGAGTMTRRGPAMMPGTSIWPEYQKGLLSEKRMGEVMGDFAGGIYGPGGYQVRTPTNPQQFGLLGSGDPRVWGGTAAENIMGQSQGMADPYGGMQQGGYQAAPSQGLLAQPTGQGGGGLLGNGPVQQQSIASTAQPQGMDPTQGAQVRAVTPSGIWDGQPDPSVTSEKAEGGDGTYTLKDLMSYEAALRGANFGNQDPISVFSMFKNTGGGTFDVDYSTPYAGQVFGMNGTPIHEFNRVDTGEPYTPGFRNEIIRNRLSSIDESP